MPTIQVDFEVFKAITARRPKESFTENDVLRSLLGLPPASGLEPIAALPRSGTPFEASQTMPTNTWPADWISKGVRFPEGTEFRAHYKGQTHLGRVQQSALVLNGERFDSPSAAAMRITDGTPTNGWLFWECRFPGTSDWKTLKSLRSTK